MSVSTQSRCLCWTGIATFLVLSFVLFYYFFVDNPDIHQPPPTAPPPTQPVPGVPEGTGIPPSDDPARRVRELVDRINSHPNRTWSADVNPWAVGLNVKDQEAFVITNDTVDEEIIKALQEIQEVVRGELFRDLYDRHVTRLREEVHFVPERFDAAERWPECAASINHVHDQGGCGSCWAIAAATLITDRICIATGASQQRNISAQDLLECCFFCGSCNGTLDPFTPFIYWYQHGIHTSDCYPYTIDVDCGYPCLPETFVNPGGLSACRGRKLCKRPGEQARYVYKIASLNEAAPHQRSLADAYRERFPHDSLTTVQLVQRELMVHGPVVLCFNVFEGFMHYRSGVYNVLSGAEGAHIYDHCVKLTGWGRDHASGRHFFKAINSWSPHWAANGTFHIDVAMLQQFRSDLYGGVPRI